MRYVTTVEWLGNKKFFGVWDLERKKLVNLELDLDLRKTEKEAQADADRLNDLQ